MRSLVRDFTAYSRTNQFDSETDGAPQSLKNEVDEASKVDQNITALQEKKYIISIRDNAYHQFPKYSFARLLSEDYNACALALYWQDGKETTVRHYYGQSVSWLLEALTFSAVSDAVRKDLLTSICQRYKDIAYTASGNKIEQQYAQKLAVAFENVAGGY